MVPKTHTVRYQGRRQTAAKLVARLPEDVWVETSTGMGVQGERRHRWACLPLSEDCPPGMRRWLLVQRSLDDADDLAYYLACGATGTTEAELLRVCGARITAPSAPAPTAGARLLRNCPTFRLLVTGCVPPGQHTMEAQPSSGA